MPGLLVKVLCAAGRQVEPGQPLVVLQAMKMENELSLPRGGTVSGVERQRGPRRSSRARCWSSSNRLTWRSSMTRP